MAHFEGIYLAASKNDLSYQIIRMRVNRTGDGRFRKFGGRTAFAESFVALIFIKNSAAESLQSLIKAYGQHGLSKIHLYEWFQHFKSGSFFQNGSD